MWNWSSIWPDTAAFWPRRMAHETSVHRVDAQQAAGAQLPIDTALATDGVDEFLMVHFAEDAGELTGTGENVPVADDRRTGRVDGLGPARATPDRRRRGRHCRHRGRSVGLWCCCCGGACRSAR